MSRNYIEKINNAPVKVLRHLVGRCGGQVGYRQKGGRWRYKRKAELSKELRRIYAQGAFDHRAIIEQTLDENEIG